MPWKSVVDLDPSREYLIMATRFTVTSRVHLPRILSATQQLWGGIEAVPGLVGFSLLADPLHGELATMTAWSEPGLLTVFVRGEAHTAVVRRTRPWMRESGFARWSVAAADLPPRWDDADRRLRPVALP